MNSQVFFDSTGRRRRLIGRLTRLLLALVILSAIAFATTIVELPTVLPLDFGHEREQPLPFRTHLAHIGRHFGGIPWHFGPKAPLRVGFYVPWDEQSAVSLRRHYDQLDWVVAGEASMMPEARHLQVKDDARLRSIRRNRLHQPSYFLMVQNASRGHWFGAGMSRLLGNRRTSDAMIGETIAAIRKLHWQGAVFDLENLPASDLPAYRAFLARAHPQFAKAGLSLALTVPAGDPSWNLRLMSRAVDHVYLMDYDEHYQEGAPGPVASQRWFAAQLDHARHEIPARKLIVALGNYGYDWHDGVADGLTVDEAWLSARDSGALPAFDPASGNSGFAFEDDGHRHIVWLMDAATTWNQLSLLGGVEGIALWRLGSEDPGFWEDLAAMRARRLPRLSAVAPASGTDVEGSGEILRIGAEPQGGSRDIRFDKDHAIVSERFSTLPSPFVVRRTGGSDPKALALTFDDGPDSDYTPGILSILEREHVPATFFVIGENALDHPELLERMMRDGDEIGNHSYTHPNLAEESRFGTLLELNATQRLIEAYTGHSTRLFRAPYFGDAEPSTADELEPALLAQQRGYTIVGLHVDPGDWRTPGVNAIIERTLKQVAAANSQRSGNVILLHDGGGYRRQTIAALPVIIDRLRAEGYRFVPVSRLAGLGRDAVMPPVSGKDLLAVRADVAFFIAIATVSYTIKWIFFFAIALGFARAALLTALALLDRRFGGAPPGKAYRPAVSVLIPAYNEERVIVASITRVLESDYPDIELIVADDGSKDATCALVATHFGTDPRVRLLTMANGGKAVALNRALAEAKGEIVIALDADTQFLTDTVGKLVRWFADPKIGAVAGNARVGNKVNLVTRWQAVEYITSQNLERRALDSLGAITVVPGAVGAWRRAALDEVGCYPEDTLAEDQDLTIAIQRKGWRVAYDIEAIALTEAPQTLRALGKQRYRWSFGTLQCLWKHRAVLRSGLPRGLAWFGMPQAWLFQIVFAALSPVIDLALVMSIIGTWIRVEQHGWPQTQSDVLQMGAYWIAFVGIDLAAGWIAYRLEPGRQRFPALLMVTQRFVYRQLMYGVVIRSIKAALHGKLVGWGKLERTGAVAAGATS
jgi:cellulose synthase/poly-beta-1,6-N-acetylglucosamine synthase-like glycosyltransferase/peptidoglycan/xylan/chitin deacetylase (PgdA/CDA1 family)/spore germination protein YaaH